MVPGGIMAPGGDAVGALQRRGAFAVGNRKSRGRLRGFRFGTSTIRVSPREIGTDRLIESEPRYGINLLEINYFGATMWLLIIQ
jgi:hypothetical protein